MYCLSLWEHPNKKNGYINIGKRLQVKVAMGVGGSIDIWAGDSEKAP